MTEDFRSAPVRIRVSCRYNNGVVISYGARALGYDESSLTVLSSENFEKGVRLNVLAPFLDGIASCRVTDSSRSREQPTYFELALKFLKKPPPPPPAKKVAAPEQQDGLLPEEATLAARELADQLEGDPSRAFWKVIQEMPESRRPLALAVTAAAVTLLLQDKAALDVRHLLEKTRGEFGS